jgi:NADH dehydrogenase
MKKYPIACIFGGTGFIGRQIVRELAAKGFRIKVATRIPEQAYALKPSGNVGQIVPVLCSYNDEESIRAAIKGCDLVINCIGILFEKKKGDFTKIHTDLPARIAKICADEKIKTFIHLSALGVDKASSKYAASKLAGEAAIFNNHPKAVILRPSVVFGEDDQFFNMFAGLAQIMPALPLIGGGKTKFQPVFVGDVADAVMVIARDPLPFAGKIIELGGPDIVDFRQIYDLIFRTIHLRRPLIALPWGVSKIQATFLSLMPKPLLTRDQVESLKTDNIVSPDALGFEALGMKPQAMETIVPQYLARFRPGGRFG